MIIEDDVEVTYVVTRNHGVIKAGDTVTAFRHKGWLILKKDNNYVHIPGFRFWLDDLEDMNDKDALKTRRAMVLDCGSDASIYLAS